MTNTILIQLSTDELQKIIKTAVSQVISENKPATQEDKLLDINQAADFLKVSIPTIYAKTSKNQIPYHKTGKRLYFVQSQLMDWIQNA